MIKKISFLIILLMIASFSVAFAGDEEGGYCGTISTDPTCVYNFLKHFSYEQYYYAIKSQFGSNNNNRADEMDISFFSGHGNNYRIVTNDGTVNLNTCGSTSHKGLGDDDCEFFIAEACQVVPAPPDRSDWASGWFNDNSIFDGLHMICGFRSNASTGTDAAIANYFGNKVANSGKILDSWLDAIAVKGGSSEKGAVVYCSGCRNDTYYSFAADPPENPTRLYIVYHT
jgi:hypothetical protein